MLRCRLSSSKIAQTSEKYQARFNIFPSECSFILAAGKDSAKLRLSERRIKLA